MRGIYCFDEVKKMTESISGIIDVIAKTGGMKVKGSDFWFNPAEGIKKYAALLKVGDMVNMFYEDGHSPNSKKVTMIKKLATGTEPPKAPFKAREYIDKDRAMIRMNAMNNAVALMNLKVQLKEIEEFGLGDVTAIAREIEDFILEVAIKKG